MAGKKITMRSIILLCLCSVVCCYVDVIDDVDIEDIANNHALEQSYINCYLSLKPCTDQMQKYKNHIQEVLTDSCQECTPHQKAKVAEFMQVVITKYPEDVKRLRDEFDPEGKFYDKFIKDLLGARPQ